MKFTDFAAAALALLLALAAPALAGEGTELRHRFDKGEKERIKDRFETVVGFTVPQQGGVESIVAAERLWEQTVKSVRGKDLKAASLQAKLLALKFRLNIPDRGSVDFDTESSTAKREASLDPIAAGVYRLKGRKFTYSVNGLGQVGRVAGLTKVVRSLFSRVKAKEAITQAAAKICMAVFSDNGMADGLREFYVPLPKKPLLPGDKWKGTMENSIYPIGVVICSVEYTLTKIEKGKAYIKVLGKVDKVDTRTAGLELPSKDDPTWGMFEQIIKNLVIESSKVTGEIVFLVDTGKVVKAANALEMKCKTTFDAFGRKIDIPFTVKKTREAERVEPEGDKKKKKPK